MLRNKLTAYFLLITTLFIQVATVLHVSHHVAFDVAANASVTSFVQGSSERASNFEPPLSSETSSLSFNWLDSHCDDCFQLGQWNSALSVDLPLLWFFQQGFTSFNQTTVDLVSSYSYLPSPARAPPV